jgi:hypothetical protein
MEEELIKNWVSLNNDAKEEQEGIIEPLKKCCHCRELKPLSEFFKYKSSIDGRFASCIKCERERTKSIYNKYKSQNTVIKITKQRNEDNFKVCIKCNKNKPITEYNIRRLNEDGFQNICKICKNLEKRTSFQKMYANSSEFRENHNNQNREEAKRLKADVFLHYCENGIVRCANPFNVHLDIITDLDLLTLDHINGDGHSEEQRYGRRLGGRVFYRQLRKEGYPEGLQVLCWNCQAKKVVLNHEYSNGFKNSFKTP